jgi:hypothetical protein
VSLLIANAVMGEVTPAIVRAVGESDAAKLLLPLTQEPVSIVGTAREPLPHLVEKLVSQYLNQHLAGGGSQKCS